MARGEEGLSREMMSAGPNRLAFGIVNAHKEHSR
jgi:hypothetical protein